MRPLPLLLILVAAALGMGSLVLLGLMLFSGPLGLVDLGLAPGADLLLDTGLALLFAVQHSLMVRRSFHDLLARRVPRDYHGAVFALASGLALLPAALLWQEAWPLVRLTGPAAWAVHGIFGLGIALMVWGVMAIGAFDLLGLKAAWDRMRGRTPGSIPFQVCGPYRLMRHPLYTASIVMLWACPAISADRLLLALLWTAWIAVATRWEERDLVAVLGQDYAAYREQVPMLVPLPGRAAPECRRP